MDKVTNKQSPWKAMELPVFAIVNTSLMILMEYIKVNG